MGAHHPRRLRPDRDHCAGRQPAGAAGEARARWDARSRATSIELIDPASGVRGETGEICIDLSQAAARADGRIPRRQRAHRGGDARRLLSHRRRRVARQRRLHHVRRPIRRRLQVVRLSDLPVRAGERPHRAPRRGRGGGGAVTGSAAPLGAESVHRRWALDHVAVRGRRALDLRAFAGEPRRLQTHTPSRVFGTAEDDLRQDPPRRPAREGSAASASSPRTTRAENEYWEEDFPDLRAAR